MCAYAHRIERDFALKKNHLHSSLLSKKNSHKFNRLPFASSSKMEQREGIKIAAIGWNFFSLRKTT